MKKQTKQALADAADAMHKIIMSIDVCDEESERLFRLAYAAHEHVLLAVRAELS